MNDFLHNDAIYVVFVLAIGIACACARMFADANSWMVKIGWFSHPIYMLLMSGTIVLLCRLPVFMAGIGCASYIVTMVAIRLWRKWHAAHGHAHHIPGQHA